MSLLKQGKEVEPGVERGLSSIDTRHDFTWCMSLDDGFLYRIFNAIWTVVMVSLE